MCSSLRVRAMGRAIGVLRQCATRATAAQLLEQQEMRALLRRARVSATERIAHDALKLAIVKHYAQTYRIPVASGAFCGMQSAQHIADWFAEQVGATGSPSHGHNIVVNCGAFDATPQQQQQQQATLSAQQMVRKLPSNVHVDANAFRTRQFALKRKRTANRLRRSQQQ